MIDEVGAPKVGNRFELVIQEYDVTRVDPVACVAKGDGDRDRG